MVGGGSSFRGVVYQCGACRSLVSARAVHVDASNERAALSCDACGARTWLPFADASGVGVVDVSAGSASPSVATSLALAGASASASSASTASTVSSTTALVPVPAAGTPTAAMTVVWSDAQRARIDARLAKLAPAGDAQGELSTSFTGLLTQWSSEAEHKNFLKKASLVGELAFAGQRYRAVLEEAPGDERAKKAQSDILGLAMAAMSREKDFGVAGTGDEGTGTGKKVLAAVIVVAGLLVCIGIVVYLPRLLHAPLAGGGDVIVVPVPEGDRPSGQNIAVPEPGR